MREVFVAFLAGALVSGLLTAVVVSPGAPAEDERREEEMQRELESAAAHQIEREVSGSHTPDKTEHLETASLLLEVAGTADGELADAVGQARDATAAFLAARACGISLEDAGVSGVMKYLDRVADALRFGDTPSTAGLEETSGHLFQTLDARTAERFAIERAEVSAENNETYLDVTLSGPVPSDACRDSLKVGFCPVPGEEGQLEINRSEPRVVGAGACPVGNLYDVRRPDQLRVNLSAFNLDSERLSVSLAFENRTLSTEDGCKLQLQDGAWCRGDGGAP